MKVSDLKIILDTLPEGSDPEIVTGEVWLPERLIDTQLDNELLHFQFDSAPDDSMKEEEGRGFVEHEIGLLHSKVVEILHEPAAVADKAQALLGLVLMAHEHSSSQVIEALENLEDSH